MRSDFFESIHEEFPHLYHFNEDIAGSIYEVLEWLNHLSREQEGVRRVLNKRSLSLEQKLTFIQAIVGTPDEDLPGYVVPFEEGSFNDKIFNALFEGYDISSLNEIE